MGVLDGIKARAILRELKQDEAKIQENEKLLDKLMSQNRKTEVPDMADYLRKFNKSILNKTKDYIKLAYESGNSQKQATLDAEAAFIVREYKYTKALKESGYTYEVEKDVNYKGLIEERVLATDGSQRENLLGYIPSEIEGYQNLCVEVAKKKPNLLTLVSKPTPAMFEAAKNSRNSEAVRYVAEAIPAFKEYLEKNKSNEAETQSPIVEAEAIEREEIVVETEKNDEKDSLDGAVPEEKSKKRKFGETFSNFVKKLKTAASAQIEDFQVELEIDNLKRKYEKLSAEFSVIETELSKISRQVSDISFQSVISHVDKNSPEGREMESKKLSLASSLSTKYNIAFSKSKELREVYTQYVKKLSDKIETQLEGASGVRQIQLLQQQSKLLMDYGFDEAFLMHKLIIPRINLSSQHKHIISQLNIQLTEIEQKIEVAKKAGDKGLTIKLEIDRDSLLSARESHVREVNLGDIQLESMKVVAQKGREIGDSYSETYIETLNAEQGYIRRFGEPKPTKEETKKSFGTKLAGAVIGTRKAISNKVKQAKQFREATEAKIAEYLATREAKKAEAAAAREAVKEEPIVESPTNDDTTTDTTTPKEDKKDGVVAETPAVDNKTNAVVDNAPAEITDTEPPATEPKKKGLFARIFGRKDKTVTKEEPVVESPTNDDTTTPEEDKKDGIEADVPASNDNSSKGKVVEPVSKDEINNAKDTIVVETPAEENVVETPATTVTNTKPKEGIVANKSNGVRTREDEYAEIFAGLDKIEPAPEDKAPVEFTSKQPYPQGKPRLKLTPEQLRQIEAEAETEVKGQVSEEQFKRYKRTKSGKVANMIRELVTKKKGQTLGRMAEEKNKPQEIEAEQVIPEENANNETKVEQSAPVEVSEKAARKAAAKAAAIERANEEARIARENFEKRMSAKETAEADAAPIVSEDTQVITTEVNNSEQVQQTTTTKASEPIQKDGLIEFLVPYAKKYEDYYSGDKGTRGHARDKEEQAQHRKITYHMKKLVAKRIEEASMGDDGTVNQEIMQTLSQPVDMIDFEELVTDERAILKLFEIATSGVYEDGGKRVRLTRKQRVALAGVLVKVADRKLEIENKKTQEAEVTKNKGQGLQIEGAEKGNE